MCSVAYLEAMSGFSWKDCASSRARTIVKFFVIFVFFVVNN